MCPGCCSYGWVDICVLVVVVMDGLICVLVVVVMDGLIFVFWLL